MKTILAFVLLLSASGVCLVQAQPQPAGADTAKGFKLCPKCRTANYPNAGFCFSCGAAFEQKGIKPESAKADTAAVSHCRWCGAGMNIPGAVFCSACGKDYTTGLAAPIAPVERGPLRNPIRATVSSMILPGTGQFYNGQTGKGFLHLGLYAGGWFSLFSGLMSFGEGSGEAWGNVGAILVLSTWAWSVVDAPLSARAINHRRGYSTLCAPGVGLVFVPDPRDPGHARPGVGFRAGF